jgi:hypothetical protein
MCRPCDTFRTGKSDWEKDISVSPEEALKELSTMYKVYLRDTKKQFRISRVVTLTKKQETILKCIDSKLLKT